MNTNERELLISRIGLRFKGVERILREVVEAKQAYKKALEKLEKSKTTYSPEYLAREKSKLKANYDATRQEAYEEITTMFDELKDGVTKKHANLDLENPAWENGLRLIELAGSSLDPDTVKKINASFQYDQSALHALLTVYKAKGIADNGELDKQIYDLEPAFEGLASMAFGALVQEESLNTLSTAISKIAILEGIEFPKTIDEAGIDEVIRLAAGLR